MLLKRKNSLDRLSFEGKEYGLVKERRVEQQIIRKSHPLWKTIDEMCFNSKNLYNYANYLI